MFIRQKCGLANTKEAEFLTSSGSGLFVEPPPDSSAYFWLGYLFLSGVILSPNWSFPR